jgi:hypothetical protein
MRLLSVEITEQRKGKSTQENKKKIWTKKKHKTLQKL